MAHVLLDVPFADVSPEQLTVAMNGKVPDMLVSTVVSHSLSTEFPELTLGVLGSSHVVFVGKRECPEFVEEVSCTALGGQSLTEYAAEYSSPGVSIEKLTSSEQLAQRVADIKREVQACQCNKGAGGVCASFPGSELAITALAARQSETGYEWTTWHVYPPSAIVTTTNSWELNRHE